jgi:tetratricopeptide (TPR) repeat protein
VNDLIFSYARVDAPRARPLVEALRALGIRVWVDEERIRTFTSITESIRNGLAQSKALLAFYSEAYPLSRACQWELMTAFLAGQHEGDPRRRVLVVNPESGTDHIYPVELRDALHALFRDPQDPGEVERVAAAIQAHVASLEGALGTVIPFFASWYGRRRPLGSTRFVGRVRQLWEIHSKLHVGTLQGIGVPKGGSVVQIRGLGGTGKSLLAEEYALRFEAAFPGGIFWLRGYGSADPPWTVEALEAARLQQFRAIAEQIGIDVSRLKPTEIEVLLSRRIEERNQPCLWVVDDVPDNLAVQELQAWLAPYPSARMLFTTRSRAYDGLAVPIELGDLAPSDAWDLLTWDKPPSEESERRAAVKIVSELGRHALALDVARGALRYQSYGQFLAALTNPTNDEMEFAAKLTKQLPNGHEVSIAGTLLRSIRVLPDPGKSLLRLATVLAVHPIPQPLILAIYRRLSGTGKDYDPRQETIFGLEAIESVSLGTVNDEMALVVHALVVRTVRFWDREAQLRDAFRQTAAEELGSFLGEFGGEPALVEPYVVHAREIAATAASLEEARLSGLIGQLDHDRGDFESAERFLRRRLEVCETALDAGDTDLRLEVLAAKSDLARALGEKGDVASALELEEEVLAARRAALGDDHPDTRASKARLAASLRRDGRLTESLQMQEELFGSQRRK